MVTYKCPCCPLMCCITHNARCTCCLIQDARAARYPCTSCLIPDTLTARYSCTCCLVPDTCYPCNFCLFLYSLTASYSCTCCLVPDTRFPCNFCLFLYTLTARYSCTCCLVPDTRYPCKFCSFPSTRTARYPSHIHFVWCLMTVLHETLMQFSSSIMHILYFPIGSWLWRSFNFFSPTFVHIQQGSLANSWLQQNHLHCSELWPIGHWPYSSFAKRMSCKCMIPDKQLTVTTQPQWLLSTHRLRDHISGDTNFYWSSGPQGADYPLPFLWAPVNQLVTNK